MLPHSCRSTPVQSAERKGCRHGKSIAFMWGYNQVLWLSIITGISVLVQNEFLRYRDFRNWKPFMSIQLFIIKLWYTYEESHSSRYIIRRILFVKLFNWTYFWVEWQCFMSYPKDHRITSRPHDTSCTRHETLHDIQLKSKSSWIDSQIVDFKSNKENFAYNNNWMYSEINIPDIRHIWLDWVTCFISLALL